MRVNPENSEKEATEEDKALRPGSLREFTGQKSIKEKLSVSIQAAKERGEPLDHVLFSGPPGLGKTTLASIVASEMGGRFHSTAAPALSKPRDLAKILTLLEKNDVLFLDEMHRLNRPCEEILYPAMEDGYIDFILGEGVSAQSIKIHLQPFTLIGATTRSGMLTTPLKTRFGMEFKLEYYETGEIADIIERSSALMDLRLENGAAFAIASRSRMTPRVANRLLRRIRDYATVSGIKMVSAKFAEECLEKLGIDELGLVAMDRKLLTLLMERYGGGPAGIKTLAVLVDEEERTLEEDHEPYLMRLGLLEKTPQGRVLTSAAYKHIGADFTLYAEGAGIGSARGQKNLLL